MLKYLLFDLDGTLTDPKLGITRCINYALMKLGKSQIDEDELLKYIGPPLRSSFQKILCSNDAPLIEKAVELYRERFSHTGIFENKVYPGIAELLANLHDGSIRLFVATSKPKVYADKIIEHFQLTRYFQYVYGSGLDGSLQNKINLLEFIINQTKLIPEVAAMIGDRKEDIIAGKLNGVKTIGVTYGYGGRNEISEAKPDYFCHSPNDIRDIVFNFPKSF
jgi:phosphoglycolate phosphatase